MTLSPLVVMVEENPESLVSRHGASVVFVQNERNEGCAMPLTCTGIVTVAASSAPETLEIVHTMFVDRFGGLCVLSHTPIT